MKKHLLVIATLDTKGKEARYVRDLVEGLGLHPVVMDIGVLGEAQFPVDISGQDVARAAGYDLEELRRRRDRPRAIAAMQEGGRLIAEDLLRKGMLDGVFGLGGGTGTSIESFIMRSLPFGIPKVIASTMASRDVREYVGTRDIVMFHTVADLLGFNEFTRLILGQAAHAVCAMMVTGTDGFSSQRLIGVTSYGLTSRCATLVEEFLGKRGYEMMGFHANGCGGMAMEEMIGEGRIAGVLDLTPHELVDEMVDGYCRGIGPSRLETAGRMGIPLVFAPGGLDNAVFAPNCPMPEEFRGRRVHSHDTRVCVRTDPDQLEKIASVVAEKLNRSTGPVSVLIPAEGWSEGDKKGMPLFDPATNRFFTERLKRLLHPGIPVEEVEAHINDGAFAERAVEVLDRMIRQGFEDGRGTPSREMAARSSPAE